jgi:hypothetical protein
MAPELSGSRTECSRIGQWAHPRVSGGHTAELQSRQETSRQYCRAVRYWRRTQYTLDEALWFLAPP